MPLVHSQTPTNHPLCKHNSSLERHYAHGSRRSQQNTSRQTGHTRPRRAARAHHPTRRPRCAMSSGRACVQMPFPHVASRSCRHNSLSPPPLALGVSRQKENIQSGACPREPQSSSATDQRAAAMLPVARARVELRDRRHRWRRRGRWRKRGRGRRHGRGRRRGRGRGWLVAAAHNGAEVGDDGYQDDDQEQDCSAVGQGARTAASPGELMQGQR